ncbi:MAG: hypothetical protein U0174_14455 [Polyangiaceae bacterium]
MSNNSKKNASADATEKKRKRLTVERLMTGVRAGEAPGGVIIANCVICCVKKPPSSDPKP